jgi:cardiolipin synthase A/B
MLPELSFLSIWILGLLLALALMPRVVLQRRESAATLSWIFFLFLVPYLGLVAYWVFGERRLKRCADRKRVTNRAVAAALNCQREKRLRPEVEKLSDSDRELIELLTKMSGTPLLAGNSLRIFPDPDDALKAMLDAIDAVGTFWTPRRFFRPLTEAGGEYARFLPVTPIPRLHANLRNHRKILVVDGRVAFTGGLNVGEEYGSLLRHRIRKLGPWRDTHLELRGPACAALQDVFVEDWHFVTGRELKEEELFPVCEVTGNELVHVVASGPDCDWEAIHHSIFAAITRATDHVYLTTPYFVPDRALLVALQTAALRGVDVRLLLPHRSDSALVRAAGRYHYGELLRAGVRVYEYRGGILHAKTVEVDGRCATIGSANLDLRSFRLNFELNITAYGANVASELRRIFFQDLESSVEVSLQTIGRWPLSRRFTYASAHLVEALL